MKRSIPSLCFFMLLFIVSNATIHHVSVANYQFSPASLPNVIVGDTIQWDWVNGGHTTTSLTIPGGAPSWDSPITSGISSFQYIATVAGIYNYDCTPHAPDMKGSFIVSAPVPVILSDFLAINNGSATVLNWRTVSEQNSAYFSVKRSTNGTDFTEIGQVVAAGTSNGIKNYSFTDESVPLNQKFVYYTVLIVDKDNRQQYSPTRMIVNKRAQAKLITSLSPNPISRPGHLMLQFNADEPGTMDAVLVDMQGKSIRRINLQAVRGINNGHIHLGDLPPGAYNLVFKLNAIEEMHRIIMK